MLKRYGYWPNIIETSPEDGIIVYICVHIYIIHVDTSIDVVKYNFYKIKIDIIVNNPYHTLIL